MRHFFLSLLLLAGHLAMSQDSARHMLGREFRLKEFDSCMVLYVVDCEDSLIRKASGAFMTEALKLADSLRELKIGERQLECLPLTDSASVGKIYEALLTRESPKSKLCFLGAALYQHSTPLYLLVVFTKRSYQKYLRKTAKEKYIFYCFGYSVKHKAEADKYQHSYILVKAGDHFNMYNVHK